MRLLQVLAVLLGIVAVHSGPCDNDEDPSRVKFWQCFGGRLNATEKNIMADLRNTFFRRTQKRIAYQWLCDQPAMPARRRQQMATYLVQKFRNARSAARINEYLSSCGRAFYQTT